MKHGLDRAIVCIVGLGYVGLPLAEAFAKSPKTIGFDVNDDKIGKLNRNNDNQNLTFTKTIGGRSAILFPITFGTLPYVVLATRLAMARLVGFEATHLLVRPPNFKRILR